MSAAMPHPAPTLTIAYAAQAPSHLLADPRVLAVVGFGDDVPACDDPRLVRVALEPAGAAPLEVWRTPFPVTRGRRDGVGFAHDGRLLFASLEIDEQAGDIESAASQAYAALRVRTRELGYPHLLRIWNYLDDITVGEGDAERYKRFCVGRARGLADGLAPGTLPAATAIGRVVPTGRLQVYWLAAREPGTPLENPRQVSAYHYPRQYGPQPPSFARAMLAPGDLPLLLSGTAAITGHQSLHADCLRAQLDETLANIDSLITVARRRRPDLAPALGAFSPLKAYVRDADELGLLADELDARLPGVPRVLLHARVCRRELRLEIDGCHR